MICNQCGKPAVSMFDSSPLCVDCSWKLQQAMKIEQDRLGALYNLAAAEMETANWGLVKVPRYPEPKPMVHLGSPTYNNIRVDRSIVGSINTGQVKKLDLTMSNIRAGGDEALAQALQRFAQAALDSKDLTEEKRNAVIEHLSFLARQAELPVNQREAAIGKTLLEGVERLIANAGNLASVWSAVAPYLRSLFQLSA